MEMEKQSRAHIKDRELRTAEINPYQKRWGTGCAPPLGNYCSECWTSHLEQLATNFLEGKKKKKKRGDENVSDRLSRHNKALEIRYDWYPFSLLYISINTTKT